MNRELDDRLIACLNKYSDTQAEMGTTLKKAFHNAVSSDKVIPVLGTQGMGKSTLINGLLGENILPNDVDETTCVPVEVKYGEVKKAIVYFQNESKTETINYNADCSEHDKLIEYVDNNYNPGNEKHVSHIELFRSLDLLKDGLVIVDLPGVGSLTHVNEETTKRYIRNLCTAIYVIPISPTIRANEAVFIKGTWSQFGKVVFVQNEWGETAEEKEESIDYTRKELQKIADQIHVDFDGEIVVVNAYNAVYGVVANDPETVKSSNIGELYNKIIQLSKNWDSERTSVLESRLNYCLCAAIDVVEHRLDQIDKNEDEIKASNEKRLQQFDDATKEIEKEINDARNDIGDQCSSLKQTLKEKSADECATMRANINKVIDGGVVDGELLSRAFDDELRVAQGNFFDTAYDNLNELKFNIDEILQNIASVSFDEELSQETDIKGSHIYIKEKLKYEKGVQVVATLGGIAASEPLAAGALGLVFANPAGLAIGAVALAIAGLFTLGGRKFKKHKQAKRAREAKNVVEPQIDEIEEQLNSKVMSIIDNLKSETLRMLDSINGERENQRKELLNSMNNVAVDTDRPQLENDLSYLNSYIESLNDGK